MTVVSDTGQPDSTQSQILIELGKLSAQVAMIQERLKDVPDLMNRVRGVELAQAENRGSRDVAARVWASLAAVMAAGSTAAAWVAILHK